MERTHTNSVWISRGLVLAAIALGSSGCASHSLEPGKWRLSFHLQRSQNLLPFPIEDRDVDLRIGWGEKNELIELTAPGIPPLYGDVKTAKSRDGEKPATVVLVEHRSEDWFWRMSGVVADPQTVTGGAFLARALEYENLVVEGRWTLRRIGD